MRAVRVRSIYDTELFSDKILRYRTVARILKSFNFSVVGNRGTHQRWKHPEVAESLIVVYKELDVDAHAILKIRNFIRRHPQIQ